ncbi:unnamed protein product [Closterium sp. NIES-54]
MEEALAGLDREKWLVSRDAEYQSLLENGTWDQVVLPEGKKAVQCKWVLRIKTDHKGQVTIYKSRLVVKGFMQKEKQDFNEIFAPTAKPPTLRVLLADAAVSEKFIIHMDISTAFLNGILEEDVYMTQPPGYEDGTGRVCKLKKSIYDLKQAPRCWYQKLAAVLEEMGFRTSSCDESLFLKGEGEKLVLFLVYVDDILLFSSSMKEIHNVQQQLMKNFKCKTLGEAVEDEGVEAEEQQQFQSLAGSFFYAAVHTRPDISFSVGELTRVVQNPSEEQMDAAERVVKYLNSHPSIGVQYSASAQRKQKGVEVLKEKGGRLGEGKLFLTCFTDATWASEKEDSSYVGGYICVVGGGPVSWRSKTQERALSSMESKYIAMFHGVKEVIWLRRLLEEIGQEQKVATPLFCDSKGALGMAKNAVLHELNKHMRIKWHWLRKETHYPTEPHCPAHAAPAATAASAPTAATAATAAMASPNCDSKDGVSLFDHTSGVSPAPAATNESTVRSQWTTRDAVARLAVRSHLPSAERAHFGQYKTAKSLYAAVVARYSSPATAALSRLMLPYLFPDLAAFAKVADLITHLRTSDARYRTALPTVDLINPLSPFSPLLLLLVLSTSLALRRSGLRLLLVGGIATARARGARVVEGIVGAALEAVEEAEGVAVEVGVVAGVGASVAVAGVVEAAAAAVEAAAAVVEVAAAVVLVKVEPRSVEALVVASASSSRFPVRPRRPSSFVSGTLGVGGLGNVVIFDLDFDAILAAMYAVTDSAEGYCYRCVLLDPGIEAAALGASESAAPGTSASVAPCTRASAALGASESALFGTAPTEAFHTFTLDSGASRSFFRDSTTLTPLSRPVEVSLANPSGGPVLAHSSTVLPCPAAPSGLLSGLHLPSFSTNLVSGADLQDLLVDQFTPGGQRVTHCTCSRTGRYLATFTRRLGSSLYTLTTASPPSTTSVFADESWSSAASAPCSCRPLSHETLLWHHRLGHPSLPRLRGMAFRTLVSGLPRSLPPRPPGPAPTCVPSVEDRQRAAPHSSEFPSTEAPLQTLHMDVWGPAHVSRQGHERYFLLVIDDYSCYTTVFPLRRKGEVTEVLIDRIRGTRRHLSESFGSDLPVLRLHSDKGGEFSSNLLRAFCRAEGIRKTFTLPASPQQNGIAERRIGMVMDVARTSMIHAAAPHFLWPFAA